MVCFVSFIQFNLDISILSTHFLRELKISVMDSSGEESYIFYHLYNSVYSKGTFNIADPGRVWGLICIETGNVSLSHNHDKMKNCFSKNTNACSSTIVLKSKSFSTIRFIWLSINLFWENSYPTTIFCNVWFQKISIPPPPKRVTEIWNLECWRGTYLCSMGKDLMPHGRCYISQ